MNGLSEKQASIGAIALTLFASLIFPIIMGIVCALNQREDVGEMDFLAVLITFIVVVVAMLVIIKIPERKKKS